jgi:hypothetical protein
MRIWLASILLGVPIAGCSTTGALHQASLYGQCAGDDAACSRRHPQAPLAIGSRFYPEVSTEIAGTTAPNLRLESAVPDVLAVEDGALVGRKPGASAVLISTDDGSVVDFVHVWVAPVTKVTLARRDGERISGPIALAVGEDLTLVPALWNGAQKLAGDGDVQWLELAPSAGGTGGGALDPATAPLAILHDGSTDRRRLRARKPGKATLVVAIGDAKASVDVEVVP